MRKKKVRAAALLFMTMIAFIGVPFFAGAAEIVEIPEPPIPMAAPPASWALLNLVIATVTVVIGVALFIGIFRDAKEDRGVGLLWRLFGILAAALAPTVFFLTENIRNPMIYADKWTFTMAMLLALQVTAALLVRQTKKRREASKQKQ